MMGESVRQHELITVRNRTQLWRCLVQGCLVCGVLSLGAPGRVTAQFAELPSGFGWHGKPGIYLGVEGGGAIRPRATVPAFAATTDIGFSWASVGIGIASRPYNLYGVEDRTARQYMMRAAVKLPSLGARRIDVAVFGGVGRAASEAAYPSDVVARVEWTVPVGISVSLDLPPIPKVANQRLWLAPTYTIRRIYQEAGVEVGAVRLRRRRVGVSGGAEVRLLRAFGVHATLEWSRVLSQRGLPSLVTVGVGVHYGIALGR